MITSLANDKVRWARSLNRLHTRQAEQHYLIEGVRLVEEALRAGRTPALVFCALGLQETARGRLLAQALEESAALRDRVLPVSERVLASLACTVAPQGVVAAVPMEALPPGAPGVILVLDRLRDPGNLGAILRTCSAAGVEEVLLPPGTVDPYNPKSVRAAMGALFRVPLRPRLSWEAIGRRLLGRPVWLADVSGGRPYTEVDWGIPSALLMGGEAEGASAEAAALASGRVHIPMQAGVESLNVAVAAGVLLFEARRTRGT
ncbi:MAG: RNA methyltransferase [Chloroflexi bacterium]|nr:RNA methyltransferase [Chloroflexota bacterium]